MTRPQKAALGVPLTQVEIQALHYVGGGGALKYARDEIGRSEWTLKSQLARAKVKLGAKTVSEAIALALAYGEMEIKTEAGPDLDKDQMFVLACQAEGMTRERISQEFGMGFGKVRQIITRNHRALRTITTPHSVYRGFQTGNLLVNRRKR